MEMERAQLAAAGVKGIINNSQYDTALDSLSPQARRHALAEAILNEFPTPVVHLKGGMYTSNLYFQFADLVSATGVLAAPAVVATDKIPLINSSDVAHAADAVLKDFDRYANQAGSDMRSPCLTMNCLPSSEPSSRT